MPGHPFAISMPPRSAGLPGFRFTRRRARGPMFLTTLSARLMAILPMILLSVSAASCSRDAGTAPTSRSLAVRVSFADCVGARATRVGVALAPSASRDAGPADLRGSGQPITEMTGRAIAIEGANERLDDTRTIGLGPDDERFRLPLSVRPTVYPAEYRVEIEARGVRESEGASTEFGLLYAGAGATVLEDGVGSQPVEVVLVEVVPHLGIEVGEGGVVLTWNEVVGALGYRVRETRTGGSTDFETTALTMTFTFDTAVEQRTYRVSAILPGGRTGAFSEPFGNEGPARGQLDLTVVDAVSGDPLAGAVATLGTRSASTDASGFVRFSDLPPGVYGLGVTQTGYVTNTREVEIVGGLTTTVRVALTVPIESGYRLVLTWGAAPRDLDSHLLTPEIEGLAYHIDYDARGSATAAPYALLDLDDQDGNGPETTTIVQSFAGSYAFYVHNWSGQTGQDAPLAGSGAQVALYDATTLLATVVVPEVGEGIWWNVLTLDAVAGTFEVVNELGSAEPEGAPRSARAKAPPR